MRAWRFSRVVLGLQLALLTAVAVILLTTAYVGAQQALQQGARQAHARDQRVLESLIESELRNIRRYSLGIVELGSLSRALSEGDASAVSAILDGLQGDYEAQHIDALVVETDDATFVSTSVSLLDTPLPLAALSRRAAPLSTWTTVNARLEGRHYSLLRLTRPILEPALGRVVGRLHVFVQLNDNFWITNALQTLFGARATVLSHDGAVLDALAQTPGQLDALEALDGVGGAIVTTPQGVMREHVLQVGSSDRYRVRSLLPDDSFAALQDTYLSSILSATLVVLGFGIVLMLVLRQLTTRALGNLVSYAEQVPQSGVPMPFQGGRFLEFNRVGKAFEAMLKRIRERDKYLSGILEHSPDLVFVKDLENRYRLVNERYAWALHSTPDAMRETRAEDALDEEVVVLATQSDRQLLRDLAPVKYKADLHTPDGVHRYLVTKFPIYDDRGRPYLVGGIATDITGITQVREQLQLVHQVFAETSEAIVVLDDDQRTRLSNRAFGEMSGHDESRATAVIRDFLRGHPEVAHHLGRGHRWQGQCYLQQRNGGSLPVLVSVTSLPPTDGERRHVLLFSDITSLKVAEQRLERLAWYDPLTGLANRSLFTLKLSEALQGEDARRTAVIFIDLDHFKDINDTHGHSLGDELLCQVADRLRSCVQSRDTVARFGGDEFTILLRGIAQEGQTMAIARRILSALSEPYDLGMVSCYSTASLGLTLASRHGGSAEALLRNADQAMYEAKSLGRQKVVLFDPSIDERHQQRLRYEAGLRQAIDNGELYALFQPRFDITGRRVVGAEALVRWQSEEHGPVPPSTFIPIAENSRLIVDIGRLVLGEACHQAARWAEAGYPVPVSVNLSPRQLHEGELIRDIQDAIHQAGLPPRLLELEITETHLMDNVDQVLPVLHQIRAMGMGLAIDDFGTGYSSLTYLKRLPIEILKIDRSFIMDVPGDVDDEVLLGAIISMAHSLNFRVVAEGVETEAQRDFLENLGCDEMQGFLLGRPQSAGKLLGTLRRCGETASP
ncbi:EAL domain-containing protein [Halomonas stenophila]|uniref:Diguanylate cyclase (GGDEF)-like protein/PAS domain S-box-containing protein n=1 Tax=Halomonas stenophila TaxID=795312 RepID=A0A7W5HK84_9GAMM|nr:EAL domain-containing protein [Halomonas stenophila]MBB3230202.1 diguanylate cyclase (GGDEF)-like protein/PAS domain S-box-containing protein [Halomonas stenophila]